MSKTYLFIGIGLLLVITGWLFQVYFNSVIDKGISVTMYKNFGCQCCTRWATHLEDNGFQVSERSVETLSKIKSENYIPQNLQSCHTALIDGYVVEGHVPASDILKFLQDRPEAIGLAVPGMPIGSPGMEGNYRETYQVYLFKSDGEIKVFSKH